MKISLILALLITNIVLIASPIGKWQNAKEKITINFKSNGDFIWKVDKNIIQGTWKITETSIIQTSTNGQITNYGFIVKNNILGLLASNGSQIYLNKIETIQINNKLLSDSQFVYLLDNYTRMHPNTVYNYLIKFSPEQRQWIPIFKSWYNMMVFLACQGTLAYQKDTDKKMCYQSKLQYQQTMQLLKNMPASLQNPWSNAKLETSKLSNYYKCKYGKIDANTCKVYGYVQKSINNSTTNTTNTIIKNFEPIPCTKHYEQGTNVYLGCW
jgi:hypothetical protein